MVGDRNNGPPFSKSENSVVVRSIENDRILENGIGFWNLLIEICSNPRSMSSGGGGTPPNGTPRSRRNGGGFEKTDSNLRG